MFSLYLCHYRRIRIGVVFVSNPKTGSQLYPRSVRRPFLAVVCMRVTALPCRGVQMVNSNGDFDLCFSGVFTFCW